MNTALSIKLCEATSFSTVIIETVGVGQSEIEVKNLCDFVILLVQPAAGDELQGIKKGIMEIADLVVVNKADGDLKLEAEKYAANLKEVFHLSANQKLPKVLITSALEKTGLNEILAELQKRTRRPKIDRDLQENHYWKQVLINKLIKKLVENNEMLADYIKDIKDFKKTPNQVIDLLLNHE